MREVTEADIKKYEAMIEHFIKDYVLKNWKEASLSKKNDEISLGNSGYTVADFRQYLNTELFIALTKYNPDYRTKAGQSVKESTFVYKHLFNRLGQLLKKMVKRKRGYGVWTNNIEEVLWEIDKE